MIRPVGISAAASAWGSLARWRRDRPTHRCHAGRRSCSPPASCCWRSLCSTGCSGCAARSVPSCSCHVSDQGDRCRSRSRSSAPRDRCSSRSGSATSRLRSDGRTTRRGSATRDDVDSAGSVDEVDVRIRTAGLLGLVLVGPAMSSRAIPRHLVAALPHQRAVPSIERRPRHRRRADGCEWCDQRRDRRSPPVARRRQREVRALGVVDPLRRVDRPRSPTERRSAAGWSGPGAGTSDPDEEAGAVRWAHRAGPSRGVAAWRLPPTAPIPSRSTTSTLPPSGRRSHRWASPRSRRQTRGGTVGLLPNPSRPRVGGPLVGGGGDAGLAHDADRGVVVPGPTAMIVLAVIVAGGALVSVGRWSRASQPSPTIADPGSRSAPSPGSRWSLRRRVGSTGCSTFLRGPLPQVLIVLIVLHGFECRDRRTIRVGLGISAVVLMYARLVPRRRRDRLVATRVGELVRRRDGQVGRPDAASDAPSTSVRGRAVRGPHGRRGRVPRARRRSRCSPSFLSLTVRRARLADLHRERQPIGQPGAIVGPDGQIRNGDPGRPGWRTRTARTGRRLHRVCPKRWTPRCAATSATTS